MSSRRPARAQRLALPIYPARTPWPWVRRVRHPDVARPGAAVGGDPPRPHGRGGCGDHPRVVHARRPCVRPGWRAALPAQLATEAVPASGHELVLQGHRRGRPPGASAKCGDSAYHAKDTGEGQEDRRARCRAATDCRTTREAVGHWASNPGHAHCLELASPVLDLYACQWQGQPLWAHEYVLSADEKTSIQVRRRCHPSPPIGPHQAMRIEHEYERAGVLQYLAAWDVHRAVIFGRCEPKTGKAAFGRLTMSWARSHT